MFQIDFMISKRLDARKVNWCLSLSRLRSESKWPLKPCSPSPRTRLSHIATTMYASISTWNLFQCYWYVTSLQRKMCTLQKRLVLAAHLPGSCKHLLVHKHILCSYAQAYTLLLCTSIGGCLHMHAWQAYLRHANYHCSLQNRARVLPSGALFEYFVLSPFFTRTAIYFFTTSSWRHRQTEVCNRTAMVRICIPSFLMHWAMSIPMPAQVLAPLTKSSISFGITCWLHVKLFCKPHRRVTISMTREN